MFRKFTNYHPKHRIIVFTLFDSRIQTVKLHSSILRCELQVNGHIHLVSLGFPRSDLQWESRCVWGELQTNSATFSQLPCVSVQ